MGTIDTAWPRPQYLLQSIATILLQPESAAPTMTQTTPNRAAPDQPTIWRIVTYLLFGRIVVSTTRRFAYPFLGDIAMRLNTPLSTLQGLMGLQAGTGLFSPLSGPAAERYGRKRVILVSIGMMVAASVWVALFPTLIVFGIGMMLLGIGKLVFDPSMQAYIADRVPFQQRGRALGLIEISWSASLITGAVVVLVAFQIDGLSLLFALLAVLLALTLGLLWRLLPDDKPSPDAARAPITPMQVWRALQQYPAAWWALAYGILLTIPHEMILVTYAAWLERDFGLSIEARGAVTIVISGAELVGELVVVGVADRIGLRRTCIVAGVIAALALGVLPFAALTLWVGLGLLFVSFIGLEVAIVAAFPLFSEVMPTARSIMLTSNVAAMSVGHLVGGLLAGVAYAAGGFEVVGVLNAVFMLGAVGAMVGLGGGGSAQRAPLATP